MHCYPNLFHYFLFMRNFNAMNPKKVINQIVVNRIKSTNDAAIGSSKSFASNKPIKTPSVTPIPAGKKEIVP